MEEIDYSSIFEGSLLKRYYCDVEGCNKSYSNRQNRHRHKSQVHAANEKYARADAQLLNKQPALDGDKVTEQPEKDRFHTPLNVEVVQRSIGESVIRTGTEIERQLSTLENNIQTAPPQEVAIYKAMIKHVIEAPPDSIERFKHFISVFSSITLHMEKCADCGNETSESKTRLSEGTAAISSEKRAKNDLKRTLSNFLSENQEE